eukprot:CAMPEP_0113681062 /NCGR_PEP_ID=MMETSP0038_2-20120614/11743_1 /TAXON_ID=2898 /ORGANISM="Cryptomonas paramecium" /LENGTH=162 /DNA_ID=CAMNT_0000599667 /DNA_START=446 /DNA_END=930 /DNA_ORIENTATION=- /assembly_acc=CAM_ASM_000170
MRCANLEALWRSSARVGFKTAEESMLWTRLGCDTVVKGEPAWRNQLKYVGDPQHFKEAETHCRDMERLYSVEAGRSWGRLPPDLRRTWQMLQCDCFTDYGCTAASRSASLGSASTPRSNLYSPGLLGRINEGDELPEPDPVYVPPSTTAAGILAAVHLRHEG